MNDNPLTAFDIRQALRKKFGDSQRYAIAEEVGLTTGFSRRRLDMMVLDCYASNGFVINGFEIKVSTSDLRRELEDPDKHIAFFDVIDYYTLVCPAGIVEPLLDIIPKKWGILIINQDGTNRYKRKPLAVEDVVHKTVPRGFLASIVRSIQSQQPSEIEKKKEYERGLAEGKESEKRSRQYTMDLVQRERKKIDAYDEMCRRFKIWCREEEISDVLDEFERFRNLDLRWVKQDVDQTIKR